MEREEEGNTSTTTKEAGKGDTGTIYGEKGIKMEVWYKEEIRTKKV